MQILPSLFVSWPGWLKNCQLLLFLILAGLGLRGFPGLSEAASLSYDCSYYTSRIGTVIPWRLFDIKIALVGDCRQNCGICQPYVDDVGQLLAVLEPPLAKVSCNWQRSPAGSNFYSGSCRLDRILTPSTSQRYLVTLIVPTTQRSLVPVTYFYYLSGDLYPPKCGPLEWTSYSARSLQAGKQAAFKVPLKDAIGFVKKSSTGAVPSEDVKSFTSAIYLSFAKEIANLSSQYSESEGTILFSFIPRTCGTWSARAGILGWVKQPTQARFDGSPFELRIRAGDISILDSRGFWVNNVSAFPAGEFGTLRVLLMDAFMNNITKATGRADFYSFNVFSTDVSQSIAPCNVSMSQEQEGGFEDVIINNTVIGNYKLHVGASDSRRIVGSPFVYKIIPGDLWVEECTAEWLVMLYTAGMNSPLKVYLRDMYGNLLAGNTRIIKFNIYTYINSGDVVYEEASYRLQSDMPQIEYVTFTSNKAGRFSYYVSYGSKQIKGSPFQLTRLPGPVLARASKGFWNNTQTYVVKGKMAVLNVIMMDAYGNICNAAHTPLLFSMYFLFSNGTRFLQPYTQNSDPQSGYAVIQITVTMDLGSWPCHVFYNSSEIGGSPFRYTVFPGNNYTSVFVQWTNNVSTFEAGQLMQEEVEFRDPIMNLLDVNKLSYHLSFHFDNSLDATNCFDISYYPASRFGYVSFDQLCLLAGTFHGYVMMNSTKVANDLSSFKIIPGPLYIPYCLASFSNNQSSYQAGELITFDVLLKDAYNNTVSKANGRVDEFNFTYRFVEIDTNISVNPNTLSRISRRGLGNETINFTFTLPGNYSLYVGGAQPQTNLFWRASDGRLVSRIKDAQQAQVKDAPFGFEITTGDPYILNYDVIWHDNINSFTPSGEAILGIVAKDVFNNTIYGTSLSQDPFDNLRISTTPRNGLGSTPIIFSTNKTEQLLMFNVSTVAGEYLLYVGDGNHDAADSPLSYKILNGPLSISNSPGIWPNGSNIFKAGTEAFLLVLLQDAYNNTIDGFVNFSLSFSIANGSNSLIVATTKVDKKAFESAKDSLGSVAVTTSMDKEKVYERIKFNMTSAGRYKLAVNYNDTSIISSPFSFTIAPGPLSGVNSIGGPWLDDKNNFKVGQKGALVVQLEDIYGNKISASDGVPKNLNGTVNCNNGQFSASVKLDLVPLDNSSSAKAVFSVDFSGDCMLSITNSTASIIGSPFNFTSYSGNISIPFCFGSWVDGSNTFTAGNQVYLEVTFRDRRRNLVQPIYPYTQFGLILKLSNGSSYSSDISFLPGRDPSHGIVTFNITLAGEFSLYVGDGRFQIQNSPFLFEVLQGPVSANYSEGVWPNGANTFEAGDTVILTLKRYDAYRNRISSGMNSSFLFFYTTWYNRTLLDANHDYEGIVSSDTLKFTSTLTGNFLMHVSDCAQNEIQGSPFEFTVIAGDVESFKVHWVDGMSTFKAGSIGILEIHLTDQFNNPIKSRNDGDSNSIIDAFVKPSTERPGVADLRVFSDKEGVQVNVSFLAISAGTYYLHVFKDNESIQGSPFSFEVVSGTISTHNCRGYWLNERNTFEAGDLASLLVEFSDAFNNNITLEREPLLLFQRSEVASNKTAYKLKRIELKPGYEIVTFLVTMSGNVSLHVTDEDNVAIFGSPFPFTVNPGPFALLNTTAEWQYGVNKFQVYSVAELFIYPRDKYLNSLSLAEANFEALVYRESSIEPLPSPDLSITPHPTISWIQVVSFTVGTVGKFKLYVTDASNGNIARSPYSFEVFEGSNDANSSIVSGSGLNQAVAGEVTSFSVQICTADGKPGLSYPGSVSVLFRKEGSEFPASFKVLVASTYFPYQEKLEVSAVSKNVSILAENSNGSFKVKYSITPGNYELYVLWTNIILNEGKPFSLAVLPGTVDVYKCQCNKNKYDTGSRVKAWNYINVILKDSSDYEVYGKADLLSLSVSSNVGTYRIKDNVDNGDGTYVAAYMPMAVGVYKINVKFDGLAIPSCSMTVYAHTEKYYPWAKSDNVRVIQDAVATIDVLYNDINGAGSLLLYNITEEPVHGTCVIYYEEIVYVPVVGFVGSDTFMYAVQDDNSNFGFGMVTIEIHAELPKIISSTDTLEVLEDEPVTFDGYDNALRVSYGNESSILTMNLQIEHGSLYQGAHASQLWLETTNVGTNSLSFQGSVNVLNEFLQSFIYIGPANYNGENYLFISVIDGYGSSANKSIQLTIQPVNDPPYILAPYKMILGSDGHVWHGFFENNTQFANEEGSEYIRVGDPDEFDLRGSFAEELQMELSLKVDVGNLTLSMPRNALEDLQYKQANYPWKQFDTTLVESDQDFVLVSAQAISFRSSINGSNTILQSFKYQGASTATLSIVVNDLGSWGCSLDCVGDATSIPLSDSATILLGYADTPQNSRESKISLATSLAILAALATIVIFILLPCFIIIFDQQKCNKHTKLTRTYDKISQNDEADFHSTRVYNPHWIPSTSGGESTHYSSRSNPLVSHLWQIELKNFMVLAKDKVLRVIKRG